MKQWDRWTEADRDQLRSLAKEHSSDHLIASIMRRPRSSVSWQRRKLRIKLVPLPKSQRQITFEAQPVETNSERIDKMMILSGLL